MNPEVKQMWVAALRSGEYEQGTLRLRSHDDKYCCLGVLCDLAVKAGVDIRILSQGGEYTYDGDAVSLPDVVQEWAGLSDNDNDTPQDPMIETELYGSRQLSQLNDNKHSFEEIADLIDECL